MKAVHADLVAAVQVGTRKASPARATEFALEGVERTVLLELGALGLARRAGATPHAATPLPEAPPETRRVAHAAAGLLAEAFAASSERFLVEWATKAAERGLVALPSALVDLLAFGKKHPGVVVPILGARGRWLAGTMGIDLVPEVPEDVRATLRESYDELGPKERGAKIAALEKGLSPEDEPILVRASADRRKETRETAVDLLLRLPDSALTRELCALAEGVLVVERSFFRKSLRVEPPEPESLPAWLGRSASATATKLGPRAHALFDLVSHVPPAFWAMRTGMSPAEIVERGRATEYGDALYRGWQAAARRFWDGTWFDATFVASLPSGEGLNDVVPRHVSEGVFEAAAIDWLRRDPKIVLGMLANRPGPFSPALSRAVVEAARKAEAYPYPYRSLAHSLDLSALPLVQASWGAEGSNVESLRDHWSKILSLRAKLLRSLE